MHISHYGRICPIETPEGTNIGLIASLSIYSDIDEYGFLITPYRVVENGVVNGKTKYLRADEEMKAILAPPDVVENDKHTLKKGLVLARVQGDLASVPSKDVQYVDISPRQTVSVSAALIPFLEHDDANRALMGSNMQRQAVPLLRVDPPIIATGLERPVAQNSGMVVRAERAGDRHVRRRHPHPDRQRRRVHAAEVRRPQRADVPEPEADRQEGPEGQGRPDHRRRGRRVPTASWRWAGTCWSRS